MLVALSVKKAYLKRKLDIKRNKIYSGLSACSADVQALITSLMRFSEGNVCSEMNVLSKTIAPLDYGLDVYALDG